ASTSFGDYEKVTEIGLDAYLSEIEDRLISSAMDENQGNVSRAAARLGIKRQSLQYKLRQLAAEEGKETKVRG
ncbi:MAG: helix-turn-helix domain-containing protein, partial [Eubacteriales bacterium]|nr:helix-turn-helix domain-containing protein [Eubacteriales bacterium]